jgi:hypothetical protein
MMKVRCSGDNWMKHLDREDLLIAAGMALMAIGLWFTVGWWCLVVLGALAIVFGVLSGLGAQGDRGGDGDR